MTKRPLLRTLVFSLLAAASLAACNGDKEAADTNNSSDTSVADTTPNYPPVDPESVKIDTTDGTLDVTGSGEQRGTWAFKDVTAVMEERAFGGKTQSILSLEAHEPGSPQRHFRIRMLRDNAPIEPGRYSFDSRTHMLDAKFEVDTTVYRSMGNAKGWAEVTSLEGNRARGHFEITIPLLAQDSTPQTLKGKFDQEMRR